MDETLIPEVRKRANVYNDFEKGANFEIQQSIDH